MKYALNKTKYLLPPEADAVRNLCLDGERDSLIISLALRTGARATELLNLQRSDLNFHDKSIFIKGIKGSNDREIPLNDGFFNLLAEYSSKVPTQKLFDISYQRLNQIWRAYRPVHKKFHSLRHTFAIELYRKTKDLRLVQVALGHSNVTNTMIYADYVYSQNELRKLIL